jgi:pimeloyl-ACP methyl ester carboxylesterase
MPIETGTTKANGLDIAYLAAGPDDGPLALCYHGFPDTAWTYRHLLPALADAGFRAVAPFLRGYSPTSIPDNGSYHGASLVADAGATHEALGGDSRAVIIGHDWGAQPAYGAAARWPDRFAKVVGLALPPGRVFGAGLLDYDQLRRSWYMFFFQSPLADMVVGADDLAFIGRLWQDWSPGYDATEDLAHVRESIGGGANLQAALGYYRSAFGGSPPPPDVAAEGAALGQELTRPLLYLHGADDGCIGAGIAGRLDGAVIVDGAGHFLHLERPDEVNGRIVDFLTRPPAPGTPPAAS